MILMLTTIQLSALMLNLSFARNPKRIVAKKTLFPCSVRWLWWWTEVPALRAVLLLGTSAATSEASSAYKKSVLDSNGSWTGSNSRSTGVADTTGPSGGTTVGKFRSNFWSPVPLTKFLVLDSGGSGTGTYPGTTAITDTTGLPSGSTAPAG